MEKIVGLSRILVDTNFHTSLQLTLFQALYEYSPPMLSTDIVKGPLTETQMEWLKDKNQILTDLRNLLQAQSRMKYYADKKKSERELQVGDWVYLELKPYSQISMAVRSNIKLTARFYGLYLVLKRIDPVAYKLQLPPGP